MAYTDIDKPDDYFNTVLYTGNGTTQSITGVGFQPDWIWIKGRSSAQYHTLYDVVRGVNNRLFTNTTDAESTTTQMTSFDSDGFSVSTGGGVYDSTNGSGITFASWNWKANGAGVSNTAGSINSTVSASTTSGFSIVSYTGNATAGATIGHGLGVAPSLIITKARANAGRFWGVYSKSLGNTGVMALNSTQAFDISTTYWNDTTPSSSVFTVGTNGDTNSASGMIAYCFAEVKGFSKFGSYTGNGSADGPFIYTGFKPAFVMFKNTSSALFWQIHDSARDPFNEVQKRLAPNSSDAEGSGSIPIDFLSNGIKLRTTATTWNESGSNLIYMAFAENPFVTSTGIPTTAR
jgi:hypothetical protein